MRQKLLILLTFVLLLCASCASDEECRKDRLVVMNIGLYAKTLNTTTKTVTTAAMSIDSITVRGLSSNGILLDSIYKNAKKISAVNLPLSKFTSESKFVVSFNKKIDTLTIQHTNSDLYLSLECGCLKVHTIDTILTTNHFVDSVKISNHTVNTTTNAENIRIYHKN